MANRLEPLNLTDFSGGLNLRAEQFQLGENESPEMNNITIDPLGGIFTRKGWERWNEIDVTDDETWDPRRAFMQQFSDGTRIIFVASAGTIYSAGADGAFTPLTGPEAEASPHDADFVAWGDYTFIACGLGNVAYRRSIDATLTALASAGAGTWNDDYTNPGAEGLVAPQTELFEAHGGYLFAANISEDGGAALFPNRLRWSHPTSPTDWAANDYIDINIGGNRITGLQSYEDHLLIFKSDSIWALYGYDLDSWQLVQKSSTLGVPSPQAITRSETVVFFYSASDRGGVYAYGGERPMEISTQLRRAFHSLVATELVWVGWLGRKLWVTVPWTYVGPTIDTAAVFVFDPTVGTNGAWVYYTSPAGNLGPLVGGSNVEELPLGVFRDDECRCLVRLEALDVAADLIMELPSLAYAMSPASGVEGDGWVITDDESEVEILMEGSPGWMSFESYYRTPWVHAGWPTRKKSFRRPDFVCRDTSRNYALNIRSFRDYEELQPKRQYKVDVPAGGAATIWNEFDWGDGTLWGAGNKKGALIRRGTSFGLCRSLQLRIEGATPTVQWGVDAVILKIVMRRFR